MLLGVAGIQPVKSAAPTMLLLNISLNLK